MLTVKTLTCATFLGIGLAYASPYAHAAPSQCYSDWVIGKRYKASSPKSLTKNRALLAKAISTSKAKWGASARRKLRSTAPSWQKAWGKKVVPNLRGGTIFARVKATYCLPGSKKVLKRTKCPKGGIKCKVNNMKHKSPMPKNPGVRPGVKEGLNPQPEPPSKIMSRR